MYHVNFKDIITFIDELNTYKPLIQINMFDYLMNYIRDASTFYDLLANILKYTITRDLVYEGKRIYKDITFNNLSDPREDFFVNKYVNKFVTETVAKLVSCDYFTEVRKQTIRNNVCREVTIKYYKNDTTEIYNLINFEMPDEDIANSSNVVQELAKAINDIVTNFMTEFSTQIQNKFVILRLPNIDQDDNIYQSTGKYYDRFGLYRDEDTYFVPGLVYNIKYINKITKELSTASKYNLLVESFGYSNVGETREDNTKFVDVLNESIKIIQQLKMSMAKTGY